MTTAAEHFDAVVVGSGFGGSVTAYRLAEAGHRVCLLERGKPFAPDSFPRSPLGVKSQFWDPSAGLHGMFDLWSFDDIDAVCASGLGGGSLIYANVLLRKDEKWFVREQPRRGSWEDGYEYWPVTRADLDPHYDRVERMMNVQRYPLDQPPYDKTPKTLAFRDAAQKLGLDWRLVNLAVTFANDGDPAIPGEPIREARPNIHGRTRLTCKLTGECDLGCNHGSKNSLVLDSAHAPVITSAIRVPDELDGGEGRGFYIEDAGQPEFVSWMLQLLDDDPGDAPRPRPRASTPRRCSSPRRCAASSRSARRTSTAASARASGRGPRSCST